MRSKSAILVQKLDALGNTKALDSALKHYISLFITVDCEANKLFWFSFCTQRGIEKGLKATSGSGSSKEIRWERRW
nr:unnamed protein product [Callosobruchus chinensis]